MNLSFLQRRDHSEPKCETLVKYGTAFEIAAVQEIDPIYRPPNSEGVSIKENVESSPMDIDNNTEEDGSSKRGRNKNLHVMMQLVCTPRNPDGTISREDMQNILNSILPPLQWTENKRMWQKIVSNMPATRQDLRNLQDHLDTYLKQRRARETGLCPIRQELYSQLFDELIRQVTITCVELGVLLVRIRNEIREVTSEYANLFSSSTGCAIRKALLAETSKADMEDKIERTIARIQKKRSCLGKLERIYAGIDKKNILRYEAIKAKHAAQYAALKMENQNLKQKLENIILPRKAAAVNTQ